ncbi:MAG: hypothetical protein AAGA85_14020 [Bacteroidota bacterium]
MRLLIDVVLFAGLLYLALGVVFAMYFYWRGAREIDQGTEGTPWHFKLIIAPGVILLWPALLRTLIRKT